MANEDINQEFVSYMQKAAKAVEEVRCGEMQHYDHMLQIQIFDSILEYTCSNAVLSSYSGLVDMQRCFRRCLVKQ